MVHGSVIQTYLLTGQVAIFQWGPKGQSCGKLELFADLSISEVRWVCLDEASSDAYSGTMAFELQNCQFQ